MRNDKTAMIYFPDAAHASSLKVVQDPTSQIRGFYFTKSQISKIEALDYANNHAVYFLFSDLEEPNVYIGQSINGIFRIKSHLKEKDFWRFGVLFVTDNNSFDRVSIDYLEYYFIQEFAKTQYNLENTDRRNKAPNLNLFNRSVLKGFASHIEFLLEALGISFNPIEAMAEDVHYFNAPGSIQARIYLQDGKYVLQKGSIIKKPISSAKEWSDGGRFFKRYMRYFETYIDSDQAEIIDGQSARLLKDIEFTSPSTPANLVNGHSNNGWKFWDGLEEKRKEANQ
ncbi:GIY-YIG nuclease family protein [Planococcus shenhongbingii]|uniref:GIY-YIG nuclease family protein n=1 Tax=Planococcus shenhongbingii TaxID=3058398 RepID=A0ABT8NGR4_9BACL|nr:GIY-YIG nuclease family protein [Planococcus sp. N017]MDN7247083.1 GIY-YIG nuclease family protein [Planococcus sp. N017]